MGTKISWADESWNPIVGCSKISAGCVNCYAEKMANRMVGISKHRYNRSTLRYTQVIKNGKWNGKTHMLDEILTKPLHWRKPRKIFVCSMGDLFHESVPFEWIDRVFAVMALCPQHQFMLLTKRAGRMREYITYEFRQIDIEHRILTGYSSPSGKPAYPEIPSDCWPLPNVHLGVTVENQDNVGRIEDLIRTPAAYRFLSIEPLMPGKLDLGKVTIPSTASGGFGDASCHPLRVQPGHYSVGDVAPIDCIYLGCESNGPKERLCTLDDIRYVMQQGRDAGVKIHVKQIPLNGKCNKNLKEWPPEFRVREV